MNNVFRPEDVTFHIIDAHAHLWEKQDAEVNGLKIQSLENGKSLFMGEVRQMLPPFMIDGRNTAEIFLSNMNYARVSAAVITQEYIDGIQNDYLWKVQQKYPGRFLCCGLIEARSPGFLQQAQVLISQGFKAIKIPAERLIMDSGRVFLTCNEMMEVFRLMEQNHIYLSVDLAPGDIQVPEMEEIISEFPDLHIAVGHFGMVTHPGWQKQIELACHDHVMIESGGITWLFNDEFYPFTGAIWAVKEAISLVGIEKLMWGSDYPRTIAAITYRMSYDFVLRTGLLSYKEKEMFLGGNAKRFYQFEDLMHLPYIKNMSE